MTDQEYYIDCKNRFETLKKQWKKKEISSLYALQILSEYKKAFMYFVLNDGPTPTRANMEHLLVSLDKLRDEIKLEMKIINLVKINGKVIPVANQSLIQKCIDRFGKENVEVYQTKICETDEELNSELSNN